MKPLFPLLVLLLALPARAQDLLIPMDERQTDHLKAYGAVYWALERGLDSDWLLNYRGGSFLVAGTEALQRELLIRGVSFEALSAAEAAQVVAEVESEAANTALVRLEKAPKIAVYAPDQTLPWDDAVMLALTYAEVPYEQVYDGDVLDGKLEEYDWLHLHHEDFSGQYGKFYAAYRNAAWYREQQRQAEAEAEARGFESVAAHKLAVAEAIRAYVVGGGFLFAMCSGTDTFDLALAAHATDVVPQEFDGDPVAPDAVGALDFSRTLAFEGFRPNFNPMEYEHSDVDVSPPPQLRNPATDYFTLFDFSAKWDPVPTMLTQNHVATIKGFMGQTTAFRKRLVKPGVVVLAEAPGRETVRYLYGPAGRGFFAFYGGHDPEDYQHFVGDPPTDLALHRNSPGYRLILNNVLFPAAKKKPQKT
ncbi:MAG: asparagine synthetase B [Rhodothermales bacterium]|nr:asparagine synthetase B [Rhodothermales bacterium]